MFQLKDKVALITGGCSGIGLSIVKEFMKNGLKGITIVDWNISHNAELEEIEPFREKIIFVQADVSDRHQFQDAFKKTVENFNQIDIVVNNAGIINEKQWEKQVSINLNGTVNGNLLALEYIQQYRSTDQGVIINLGSTTGLHVSGWNPVYAATKHAVIGLSRSLGLDVHYNNTKIKIITICPGPTSTTFITERMEDKILSMEYFDVYYNTIQNYNFQSPTHVAKELCFLIKDASSGSIWIVENGESAYEIEIPHYSQIRMLKKNCIP